MAERADINVLWGEDVRLVEVALPSVVLINQDLHDTLNSNTLQPGMPDDSLDNMDDDPIIASAGKEDLGGGVEVGITSSLLNAQVAFGATSPVSSGTITTADSTGIFLEDSTKSFLSDGTKRGDWIINFDDESVTEILEVVSDTILKTRGLRDGTTNQFNLADRYKVWEVSEATLSGGNTVAEDALGNPINPLFTTFGRFATKSSSSSATLASQTDVEHASFGGAVNIKVGSGNSGTGFPIGNEENPVDNLADALIINTERSFNKLRIINSLTIGISESVSGLILQGDGLSITTITHIAGCTNEATTYKDCKLTGTGNGSITAEQCDLLNFEGIGGLLTPTTIRNSIFESGFIRLRSDNNQDVNISSCESGAAGISVPPDLDVNGSTGDVTINKYSGSLSSINITSAIQMSFSTSGGTLIIDSSDTAGTITASGDTEITGTSGGTAIIDNTSSAQVWGDDDAILIRRILQNRTITNLTTGNLEIWNDDNTGILYTIPIYEGVGTGTPYAGNVVNRRERIE